MKPHHPAHHAAFRRTGLTVTLAFAGLLAPSGTALRAQNDTIALAAAIVRAQAAADDDPDAVVRDLFTTALSHRRSPVAWFLVQEAIYLMGQLQDASAVCDAFRAARTGGPLHGRLQQKCVELQWWLDRAVEGTAAHALLPPLGYCRQALVAGPFGDDGDNFVGIAFPPEFQFPALGTELPGRGTKALVRHVSSRRGSDYLELRIPGRSLPGCYYALQRLRIDAPIDAFLEVEFEGDFQVFVDQSEVLRVERWRATAPRRHHIGLHLPPGEHHVLVKTCSIDKDRITLRWLDGDAVPVAAIHELPPDAAAGPIEAVATPTAVPFVTAEDVLLRAAEQPGSDPALRIAGLLLSERENHHDLALRFGEPLRHTPPSDAEQALAFARVLRFAPLPDELRKASARKIEEAALTALPESHHAALLARVNLLEEQDQREQALRLLAAYPTPGTWTFQRHHSLLRRLKFTAEELPLLHAWAAACPRDPRPLLLLAEAASAVQDSSRALALQQRALALHRDQSNATQAAVRRAIDTGDHQLAGALLDAMDPRSEGVPEMARLHYEWMSARARDDTAELARLLPLMANHPEAGADLLVDLAGRATRLGDQPLVVDCLHASLTKDPDQPRVRAWLAALGQMPAEHAAFVRFRRDGDAARASFTAGDREQTASSTVLLDQRIVELHPDGSWTAEAHELRRINDQAGVDAFRTASGLGQVDEVLVVRTIGTDGQSYVPARVENEYAMQRLEPGAFVEWRYRERGHAPGAGPISTSPFLFGSDSEPVVLCELVVIQPLTGRGELRTRSLGEPTATHELDGGRRATVFVRENLAALPREQFLPPVHELLPLAQLGEDDAPFSTLRNTRVQIGSRTRPTAPIEQQALALTADLSGEREKVAAVWAFCQTDIESGPANNALDTLLHKKGSRFLLAVALLRASGLQVVPLACREAKPELNRGGDSLFAPADTHDVPGAMVTLTDGERIHLFVDTPRHWPLGLVPAKRAGSRAYALLDDRVEAIVLPGSDDAVQTIRVRGTARIDGNEVQLEATAELGDVAGFGLADRLSELKDNQQKLAARQIAQQLFPGFRVRGASIADVAPGTPMRLEVQLSRTGVQANGDTFVVPLPLPPMKYTASFGDRADRTLPYQFLGDMISDWQVDFDAGAELRFLRCPEPVAIRIGPFAHELQCTRRGDHLLLARHTRLGPGTLPAAKFGDWLRALADADRSDQGSLELTPRKIK